MDLGSCKTIGRLRLGATCIAIGCEGRAHRAKAAMARQRCLLSPTSIVVRFSEGGVSHEGGAHTGHQHIDAATTAGSARSD